jgi:hypothetical protein
MNAQGRHILDCLASRFPERLEGWFFGEGALSPLGLGLVARCVRDGHQDTLRALLDEHHVPVNIVSTSACSAGAKILTRLMDWKVRFQRRWRAGFPTQIAYGSRCTALHIAAFLGHFGALEMLLERSAEVNSAAHAHGMTPLHLAALSGHNAICTQLIAAGASTLIKDRRGRTPVDRARWAHGDDSPVTLLLLRGQRNELVLTPLQEQEIAPAKMAMPLPSTALSSVHGSARILPHSATSHSS